MQANDSIRGSARQVARRRRRRQLVGRRCQRPPEAGRSRDGLRRWKTRTGGSQRPSRCRLGRSRPEPECAEQDDMRADAHELVPDRPSARECEREDRKLGADRRPSDAGEEHVQREKFE
jgi:hypothetical protein